MSFAPLQWKAITCIPRHYVDSVSPILSSQTKAMKPEVSDDNGREYDGTFTPDHWPIWPCQLQQARYLRLLLDGWDLLWIIFTVLLLLKIVASVLVSLLDGYQWGREHHDVDWLSSLLVSFDSQVRLQSSGHGSAR